jgi:short-subunit dehydrogenase
MAKPLSPILIIGARSDIARALAHEYAARGCDLILGARDAAALEADCADLALRHKVTARAVAIDVTDGAPDAFFAALGDVPGTVVMVAGLLGDQDEAVADDALAARIMETNYNGPARYLLAAARVMQAKGSAIIGISSVAGDRGRGSNLVYGSAKAGFTAFLSGLRNRLAPRGIQVLTVKPGFVDTKMTEGMKLPGALTAQPEAVARAVLKAHNKGRSEIYAKAAWRPIMAIIRTIPEPVFKRMKL